MATLSGPLDLELLFQSALEEYKKETGINLIDSEHPLVAELERCDSPESITLVLQEKAQAFCEFRKKKPKGIELFKHAISALHKLSGIAALGKSIGFSPIPFVNTIHTCIGMLFGVVKDVSASYDALMELLETMGNLLQRLEVYSKLPPTKDMTEIVVKILVGFISTLAVATKQITQGRLKKFGKKLIGDNDIEDILRRIDRLTAGQDHMVAAHTLEVVYGLVENLKEVTSDRKALTDGIQKNLEMIQELTSETNKSEREKLQENVQKWLSSLDPSHLWDGHLMRRGVHYDGTATWFIRGDTFAGWKSSGSLFWVRGNPGSGKSVLCSSIIENIDDMRNLGLAALAFYYFDFRDKAKNGRHGLLSSLLSQLCDQSDSYCDTLSHLYATHRGGRRPADDNALAKCLKDMLKSPGQAPVYLILDGLDECPNASGMPSSRENVLELIKDLVDLRLPNVRICVASRPEVDIALVLEPLAFHSISLHDEGGQKQDILDYVSAVVRSDTKMQKWREEDKHLVIRVLSQKADGMFRWLFCQLERLRHCLPGRIQHQLDELPTTLDATYTRTLEDIDESHQEYAHSLFQCVAVASRPLRVEELAEFIAFDLKAGPIPSFHEDWRAEDPVNVVLATCSTLLEVVDGGNSRVIQFSHFSVKEYFTSPRHAKENDGISHLYHISIPQAHTLVMQVCLGMLLHLDKGISRDSLRSFPLAEYAAEHWVDHARSENASEAAVDAMKQLFDLTKPHFAIWVWIYDAQLPSWKRLSTERAEAPLLPRGTPLHYAALCGLQTIVKFLVDQRPHDVHSRGFDDLSTPLHEAASGGDAEVARILLERGADATVQAKDGSTPLHHASERGHAKLARVLLEYGATAAAQDMHGWTPLHRASYMRQVEVVRVFVDHGVGAIAKDNRGTTPLHWVSSWGDVELAHILLECGADATAQDEDGSTPLHQASEGGHVGLAEILIERGASARAQKKDGSTPLHRASDRGFAELARFLLERGADATAQDFNGSTPLHRASQLGHVDFARVLLEYGANATDRDENGTTPLHLASEGGHLELARMLIKHGADSTAQRNDGSTPLHRASVRGQVELALFLLECGAHATAQDNDGRTPLHWASYVGSVELARVLLEHGAKYAAQEKRGFTPLHWASEKGHVELTLILLESGADVMAQDELGLTPLHQASKEGHAEVSRILLKRGAYATAQDKFGCTPLYWAMATGDLDLLRILLEGGVDVAAFVQAFFNPNISGGGQKKSGTSGEVIETACVSEISAAGSP